MKLLLCSQIPLHITICASNHDKVLSTALSYPIPHILLSFPNAFNYSLLFNTHDLLFGSIVQHMPVRCQPIIFKNYYTSVLNHNTTTINNYPPIITHDISLIKSCTSIAASTYVTYSSSFMPHTVCQLHYHIHF